MVSNIPDLIQRLETLDLPIAYEAFQDEQELPFICYLISDSDYKGSDDMILMAEREATVELYTAQRDFTLEEKLINALSDYGDISVHSEYIKEENMNLTYFDFSFVEKIG